ncbi:MAG: GspH/FimT family pseudopilin [Gammaproteobacteria bacterium]
MQNRKAGGFTLVETMFVVTIAAIGLAIGVPSFSNLMKRNRITASINEVITGFQLARSEAAKRSQPVTVCQTDSPPSTAAADIECAPGGDWNIGMIAFVDANADGDRDDDDEILFYRGEMPDNIFVNVSDDLADGLTYGADGFPSALLNASQMVFCDEEDDQTRRAVISMSVTGRPATARSMTVSGDLEC